MPSERVIIHHSWPRYVSVLFPLWLFFAFFTQLKLVPGLDHNIGAFEVVGALVAAFFILWEVPKGGLRIHPLLGIVLFLLGVAVISQIRLPGTHREYGMLQVALLVFFAAFLWINHNLLKRYHLSVAWLTQIIIACVFVAGVLVVVQGVQTGGDIQAAGPFRNRAHMASYMLTSFWLCLVGTLWPGVRLPIRFLGLGSLCLSLYCIAVSGRRSVYLALFLGLICLMAAVIGSRKGRRLQWLAVSLLAVGFLYGMYSLGAKSDTRIAFFRTRIGLVDDRVASFLGRNESANAPTFFALQRQGVMMAFRASPILGIGWGGFPDSEYSPTGHEVHSTPMRFLAELGIVGLALYLVFMGNLLARSMALYRRMRASPYQNAYLALMLGIWTMSLSYIYNRHITERTFWILLAVLLAMEVFAADWHQIRSRLAEPRPGRKPAPHLQALATPGS
ncbi:MAG: O-antigen ligase family protein [Acidimicrobiia bacterium]|nr:O-antigen ligase family protein [Acidimicrobiia bacterium]